MRTIFRTICCCVLLSGLASVLVAQGVPKASPSASVSQVQQGLTLAEQGRCDEALPSLKKSLSVPGKNELKLRAGLATVRCAMALNKPETALDAIRMLNRDFPHDPDVLYATTHAYSDLSTRASMELIQHAPASHQARELNAESLELQGKWDEAAAEYWVILKENPNLPGIHFHIGRIILSKPETPTTTEDAKKEFEAELKIDPTNAGAEYILGEVAQHEQNWDQAIEHFGRAVKIQPDFAEASLGLGTAYISTGQFSEAVPPLEKYVRLVPANPGGHYQLTLAYKSVGRNEDAAQEAEQQRKASAAIDERKNRIPNTRNDASSGSDLSPSNKPQ